MGQVSDMRDQYNCLKAIDTSSSSPELKEPAPQQPLERPRRHQLHAAATASLATTSSSASSGAGRFSRNKLQNLIKPTRFQLSSSGESKSSFRGQPEAGRRFARQEHPNGQSDPDEQAPLDNVECQQRRLFGSDELVRRQPVLRQQLEQAPAAHQTRNRPLVMMPLVGGAPAKPHLSESKLAPARQTTGKTSATPLANYYAVQSDTVSALQNRHELAKCYDEIDQIYDYIRGLAPLPAQLRKIKAIDFEQIEREHQRHKANQQLQQQQPIHHIHRQRFVKSISLAQNESGGSSESTTNDKETIKKSTAKVRQRVVPELIGSDPKRTSQNQTQANRPSKLRDRLQFLVPMPIRVTTRAGESQKPSIKRVESLNLNAIQKLESKPIANLEAKLIEQRNIKKNEAIELNSTKLSTYNLLRTSGVAASPQRGNQLFRLPRAHSTSTLNKPMNNLTDSTRSRPQQRNLLRRPAQLLKAAIREESPPVVSLKGIAYEHAFNSLIWQTAASKKRPSFESELVESYVDEDENDEQGESRLKSNPSASLKSRQPLRPIASSWNEMDNDSEGRTSSSTSNSSASDKWSYAHDSSKNQRSADGKSHSDYDHESASGSRTSAEETISDSSTTTSSDAEGEAAVEEDKEVRASFRKEAPPSRRASSTSRRSHRPTTSSSPSSGRPASPVDMTNESDDRSESDSPSGLDGSSSSLSSSAKTSSNYKQPVHRHEEHIYEQIPSHRDRAQACSRLSSGNRQANERHKQAIEPSKQSQARVSSCASRKGAPVAHAPGLSQKLSTATINHPVAYAANVATNRRYQQQVAALFALQQQQRNRHQQSATNPRHKLATVPLTGGGHQRRASASNVQLITTNPANISNGPTSLNVGSLKWKHRQTTNEMLDVPLRQRLSMSNIHLLSGLPLATLRSPRSKRHQELNQQPSSAAKRLIDQRPTTESKRELSQRSLDDQDAESTTGTTNSTSSYEAAIKNSEPDPLRVDMISPPSDGELLRPASSKRSIGSGSGSRSLTNHSHHQALQPNSGGNSQQQQQTSLLVKVPKLSKQSHLLKRPLPKPPASLNRSHAGAGNHLSQPQKVSNSPRVRTTAGRQPIKAFDVFTS